MDHFIQKYEKKTTGVLGSLVGCVKRTASTPRRRTGFAPSANAALRCNLGVNPHHGAFHTPYRYYARFLAPNVTC